MLLKNIQKTCTNVRLFKRCYIFMTLKLKMRLKVKNRSHRYNINRPRPRHGLKYTKYKMCLNIIMVICIKQHLSYI